MRLQALTKLLAHGSPSFSPEVVAMLATAAREGARPADGSELFWAIVECPRARDAAVEIAPELGSLQCPREP